MLQSTQITQIVQITAIIYQPLPRASLAARVLANPKCIDTGAAGVVGPRAKDIIVIPWTLDALLECGQVCRHGNREGPD